ncbi:MAG: septal ring lytic transglycosylase RlpA family protein [Coriobacteriia bacterium]|nr:septal ring lytic transglycosylase RlpA family protein [Coriobacteriia bacterium]
MKVRSSSLPMTGAIGVAALVLALVVGSGLEPAAGLSADTKGSAAREAAAEAAAVLEAKTDQVESASPEALPALTAVKLKTATPLPKPAPRRPEAKKPARSVAKPAAGGWRTARVSWYGPGFYGHKMAGGGKLTPTSMVVAHRTLPFGTKVEIEYKGRRVLAVVMDRGPFVRGRTFDLGPGTAQALRFSGVGTIRWRIVR